MSIVTRTGDKGETGLFGGKRVSKSDSRMHAYGTVDELNAYLGLILTEERLRRDIREHLSHVQNMLFRVGGDLATPMEVQAKQERVSDAHVADLEDWINSIELLLPVQTAFLLPGGTKVSSLLHIARTICRRAERWVTALKEDENINPQVQIYLNRLSDYLFVAARASVLAEGKEETPVRYQ